MPRTSRVDIANIPYHVISRANARMQIFDTDRDYNLLEKVLKEAKDKFDSIIVPPKESMVEFNKTIKPIFDKISNNIFENQKLVTLRDLLLPKLMSGEIGV